MNNGALSGTRVLVTRPAEQSKELIEAIGAAGGRAFHLPVIEIVERNEATVLSELASLPTPDIVIYVSRNAVIYGAKAVSTPTANSAAIAAIGPATRNALEEAGYAVTIFPDKGFDSEHLLEHASLLEVAGRNILIVRGTSGRELLADTLQARGATVNYLAVYDRSTAKPDSKTLSELASLWSRGNINVVIAMSVDSLTGLLEILPADCLALLKKTLLVTPSQRVIQAALATLPGSRVMLAQGPQAANMVDAVIQSRHENTECQT